MKTVKVNGRKVKSHVRKIKTVADKPGSGNELRKLKEGTVGKHYEAKAKATGSSKAPKLSPMQQRMARVRSFRKKKVSPASA